MKSWGLWGVSSLILATCLGCRTTKDVLNDYEANLRSGNYAAATGEVSEKAKSSGTDQLLWQLLAGGAWYMADNKPQAIDMFDKAEDTFIEHDKASVFAGMGEGSLAMLNNDKSFSYDGGGEDRVFTCLYKAIDYIALGKNDAARTELNRAAEHQENWIWQRRKDIAAAEERLNRDIAEKGKEQKQDSRNQSEGVGLVMNDRDFCHQIEEKTHFNPFTSGDLDKLTTRDYVNAYVQHVTGVFRWLNGDSGVRELFRDTADLSPNASAKRDLADADRGAKPKDQVWIYVEDGLCPCREEWRLDLPFILIPWMNQYVLYAGMALPYLHERTAGASVWSVSAGGQSAPVEELANVDKLVKTEYDVYMRGALKREVTRTVVKAGVQVALGIAANNTSDWKHQLALRGAQLAAAAWARGTTAADLRSWTSLPKTVRMVRVTRPADGKIILSADSQQIVLTVPAGNSLVFVRKPAPAAFPVIKTLTYAK